MPLPISQSQPHRAEQTASSDDSIFVTHNEAGNANDEANSLLGIQLAVPQPPASVNLVPHGRNLHAPRARNIRPGIFAVNPATTRCWGWSLAIFGGAVMLIVRLMPDFDEPSEYIPITSNATCEDSGMVLRGISEGQRECIHSDPYQEILAYLFLSGLLMVWIGCVIGTWRR